MGYVADIIIKKIIAAQKNTLLLPSRRRKLYRRMQFYLFYKQPAYGCGRQQQTNKSILQYLLETTHQTNIRIIKNMPANTFHPVSEEKLILQSVFPHRLWETALI